MEYVIIAVPGPNLHLQKKFLKTNDELCAKVYTPKLPSVLPNCFYLDS